MTYFHSASGAYVTAGTPFILADIQYPANWLDLATPEDKAALGLVEVTTVETVPADYRYHNRTETLVGDKRIVTWTPFPTEQITQMKKADLQAQIDALERQQMLPRISREFTLGILEAQFTPAQLSANVGYTKLKEFDALIGNLRTELAAL